MQQDRQSTEAGGLSRIFYPDGRVLEYPPEFAYLIWLAASGTALRVAGDDRPVMPWEYFAGAING